jgi:hypothetical protein
MNVSPIRGKVLSSTLFLGVALAAAWTFVPGWAASSSDRVLADSPLSATQGLWDSYPEKSGATMAPPAPTSSDDVEVLLNDWEFSYTPPKAPPKPPPKPPPILPSHHNR